MADNGIAFNPGAQAMRVAQYGTRSSRTLAKTPDQLPETQKLKAACDNFEALFMQQMLKQMRATVPKDGLFSGGSAEEIYSEMLDSELSKEMAESGGLGISKLLFEHMTAAQRMATETKD